MPSTSFRTIRAQRRSPPGRGSCAPARRKHGSSGRSCEDPGNCGQRKSERFAEPPLAEHARVAARCRRVTEDEDRHLRGLLLPAEPALRARARKPCTTFRPGRARPRARAAAHLRLPHRADDRGVRVSAAQLLSARPWVPSGPQPLESASCGSPSWASRRPGRTPAAPAPDTWSRTADTRVLVDCGNGVFGKLRALLRLRRRGRGGDLAPPRRPLPRPRAVLVRAHLRAAPAAGAGARAGRAPTTRAARACIAPPRRAATRSAASSGAWGNEDLIENAFDLREYDAGRPARDRAAPDPRSSRCRTSPRRSR